MKVRKRNQLRQRARAARTFAGSASARRLWKFKRARQAAFLASGADGRWFKDGVTLSWKRLDAPD
ncbi:MAG: hypothetical protein JSS56_20990 [Proteobacteria bacterium]|nr:hypothetical protein [Pseudomonadota bacterium]